MKNRKGSALVLTLIIFAVLMIFGTSVLGIMLSENKMSLHHQRKTQAYYIARAGAEAVEAAIMEMDKEEIEKLNKKLDEGTITIDEMIIGEGKSKVELTKGEDKLNIESRGQVDNIEDKVTKVMMIEQKSSNIKVEHAIFSLGDLKLENGTIVGDVGTNNSIIVPRGNPSLNGDAYIMRGNSFSAPEWWKNNWIKNFSTKNLGQERIYDPIKFPTFPVNNSAINFIQGGRNQTTIFSSKAYNKFEVNDNTKVYIDTTQVDVTLNIKEFNLNNGHMIILGNNKLTIYVENMVIGAGSTINYNGDPKQVNIIHKGTSKLTIAGNVKIAGNLYIEKAELELGGSGGILGNVYSNGSIISLTGDSDITKGLIYAPNANIKFSGSGKAQGAIIGKTVTIEGGGKAIFDSNYIDTSLISSTSELIIEFKPSHYK